MQGKSSGKRLVTEGLGHLHIHNPIELRSPGRESSVRVIGGRKGQGAERAGKEREVEVERKRDKGEKSVLALTEPQTMEKEVGQRSTQMETAKVMVKILWCHTRMATIVCESRLKKEKLEASPVFSSVNQQLPYCHKESRLQKLKDLTKTWDGKKIDVKREKEKDNCKDRSEKETKITQRLLAKVRETSLTMWREIK
ncbi:hypothetical protein K435DRAFT_796602 [Dendrothele bispora CBS 962.96]|uniref:Uncharacterized protein n=1 Tax=Dendrothele bispora (strain CBS 962.96) TaxID=1314807 RepID=A0A4S8M506_DENBC|nr:hypothetical protein K435DRAFT_796602 [Dendrothele bispora CBS 962.96]